MSAQANVSGTTHNPSPYLRRYRLPVLPNASTSYDDLLSPIDNNAKLAFIAVKNAQLSSVPSSTSSSNLPQTASSSPKPTEDYGCSTTWCYRAAQPPPVQRPTMQFELGAEIEEMERRNRELLEFGYGNCRKNRKVTKD
ncbi:hypothetical protein L596_028425 [Steinernema carpocapsae]|uniref:Uncharacterized protein n=1 Tax=Steinernema carpocapsae TaxID=34508 RepID=A0A4U5LYG1_STECR|nr:hypothetical protein L596_028425 [Steinernema carpocapsae]